VPLQERVHGLQVVPVVVEVVVRALQYGHKLKDTRFGDFGEVIHSQFAVYRPSSNIARSTGKPFALATLLCWPPLNVVYPILL